MAMNRHDTEEKMLDLLEEIMTIYHQYNPGGKYLSLNYMENEGRVSVSVNNSYYHGGDDENHVIVATRWLNKEEAV